MAFFRDDQIPLYALDGVLEVLVVAGNDQEECVAKLDASRAGESLGLPAGRAALHVDDLAVPEGEYLEALLAGAGLHPSGGADDDAVADLGELGLDVDSIVTSFADLESQDLTGLVGAVSGGCAFPPQVPVWDAAPFAFVRDQLRERTGVAAVERLRCRMELVDHTIGSRVTGRFAF